MTIEFGNTLSKTHLDAAGDDPAQARAELEAIIDRLNNKLANVTLLQLSDKTGNDAGIVSGTAGTDGNLGQWNADGDLVDSGMAASDVATESYADAAEADAKTYADDKFPVDQSQIGSSAVGNGELKIGTDSQSGSVSAGSTAYIEMTNRYTFFPSVVGDSTDLSMVIGTFAGSTSRFGLKNNGASGASDYNVQWRYIQA